MPRTACRSCCRGRDPVWTAPSLHGRPPRPPRSLNQASFPGPVQTPSCRAPLASQAPQSHPHSLAGSPPGTAATPSPPGWFPPRCSSHRTWGGCPSLGTEPSKSVIYRSSRHQAGGTRASPGYRSGPWGMEPVQLPANSHIPGGDKCQHRLRGLFSGLPARTPQG